MNLTSSFMLDIFIRTFYEMLIDIRQQLEKLEFSGTAALPLPMGEVSKIFDF